MYLIQVTPLPYSKITNDKFELAWEIYEVMSESGRLHLLETVVSEKKLVLGCLFTMDEHNVDRNKRKKGVKSVIWQCERIKRARIKGDEYVNYKGNVVPKKEMGLNCNTHSVISERVPFNISTFMQFSYNVNFKGTVTAYDYIDGFINHTFRIGTKHPRPTLLCTEPAYPNVKVPIKNKKMINIKSYLADNKEIQTFYKEVFLWPTMDGELEPEVE
ncbi:hypothetical protein FQA39_LY06172 [Lamprigera yunnana]|nr:hypothetical protein FQA39_LY06172 [Lamprigera yunnana]